MCEFTDVGVPSSEHAAMREFQKPCFTATIGRRMSGRLDFRGVGDRSVFPKSGVAFGKGTHRFSSLGQAGRSLLQGRCARGVLVVRRCEIYNGT